MVAGFFFGVVNPGSGESLSELDSRTAPGLSVWVWGDGGVMVSSKPGPEEAGGEKRTWVRPSGTAMETCMAPNCG